MGNRGKESISFFRNGAEEISGVKLKPEYFDPGELATIAALHFNNPNESKIVLVEATRIVVVTPEYMSEVMALKDRDQRHRHIVDTAIEMGKSMEVHIQPRGSK